MGGIVFEILRDKQGRIIGFSLKGRWNKEAQAFCVSFMISLALKRSRIQIEENELVFIHGGVRNGEVLRPFDTIVTCHGGGEFRVAVSYIELSHLRDILSRSGEYEGWTCSIKKDFTQGRGFKLTTESPKAHKPA